MILYKYIQCIYQLLSYTADFQSLSCSLLVILYYIRPICYAVSGWVFTSSCYSFVICLYFYNTSQGHSVDLQLFFIFFLLLPSLTTFDLYSIFTFFLLWIFVYFIMLKKSACLRGHLLLVFEKSKMASILLVVLMVCICSDR